ncbi:MAG: STAS domain-containing protein [Planctomycetota bacterium]
MDRTGLLYVGRVDGGLFASVVGLGTMHNAYQLQERVQTEGPGVRRLWLDLRQCPGIDSTFMGVLAGFLREGVEVQVFGVGPRAQEQMEAVGLDRLVQFVSDPPETGLPPLEPHPAQGLPPASTVPFIEQAHRSLASSSPEADRLYSPFLKRLEDERKRSGQG